MVPLVLDVNIRNIVSVCLRAATKGGKKWTARKLTVLTNPL